MQNTHLAQCYLWNQLLVFKKKIIYGNALQTERKLYFSKKQIIAAVLLYKTFYNSVQKTSIWASVTSESNIFSRFGSEKRVLWPPNYSNKHPFSTNKHTFHGNTSFLVKRFCLSKFFRPKKNNKSCVSHLETAEKHGESSVRFWFGAAPLPLSNVFENVTFQNHKSIFTFAKIYK